MKELIKKVRSGVVHINYMRGAEKIGSGSGFMAKNLLVTNNHVIKGPEGTPGVDIPSRFDNEVPAGPKKELRYHFVSRTKTSLYWLR